MENLQNELEKMRAENAAKLVIKERELAIKCDLFAATGLEFMVLIHQWKSGETVSAWIDNSSYKTMFDRSKLAEYYQQLCTILTPAACNFTASSKDIINAAPAKVTISNNTAEIVFNHPTTAKIEFSFTNGLTVSFTMPIREAFNNNYLGTRHYCGKPNNKRDRMEKTLYYLAGFDLIHWRGDSYTTYTTDPDQVKDFMRLLLTNNY